MPTEVSAGGLHAKLCGTCELQQSGNRAATELQLTNSLSQVKTEGLHAKLSGNVEAVFQFFFFQFVLKGRQVMP